MSLRSIPQIWIAVALFAACVAGCAKSPTAPTSQKTYSVAATVEDSTGARLAHADVSAWGPLDGPLMTLGPPATSDAAGVARFTLAAGRWCLYTGGAYVAGSIGQVGAHPDTVLFRLVVRPGSVARGRIMLAGQTSYGGTLVDPMAFPSLGSTAADGSYELSGLPPGTWTIGASHLGFQDKLFDVTVPAPGDTITAATITLVPGGPVANR